MMKHAVLTVSVLAYWATLRSIAKAGTPWFAWADWALLTPEKDNECEVSWVLLMMMVKAKAEISMMLQLFELLDLLK